MKIATAFPRYTEYEPRVPVWCLTPNLRGCFHRFFDTSPISPSGRYLVVLQMPQEERPPEPGEKAKVVVIDLETGEDRVVAETCGWETQMGANINWGGTDRELFFNDVTPGDWQKPFAWKLDFLTGEKQRMGGTVYHASPDGKLLVSANLTLNRRTQPGYGVVIPDELGGRNVGAVEDDGFYLTDTATGECRMLVSIREMIEKAEPKVKIGDPDDYEIYGFHSKFNARGDRLMLSLRWFPNTGESIWDMFSRDHKEVRYAWITMRPDGSEMHCAVGPEEWEKGGHHATWFPDGERISMNLNIDRECLRFVQVNYDGTGYGKMLDNVPGSGHPSVSTDGTHILTDTYAYEGIAYGDGTIPLRWVDMKSGEEEALVRINTKTPYQNAAACMRVDPHPAWDRTGRYVVFNGFTDGTRKVYMADMRSLL